MTSEESRRRPASPGRETAARLSQVSPPLMTQGAVFGGHVQGLWTRTDLCSSSGSAPRHRCTETSSTGVSPKMQGSPDGTGQHGLEHRVRCPSGKLCSPSLHPPTPRTAEPLQLLTGVGYLAKPFIGLLIFPPKSSKGETKQRCFFKISYFVLKKQVMRTLHFIHNIFKIILI